MRNAVERLCNCDMAHRGGRSRAVPMFLARREPDDVTGADFLDRSAVALRPAPTGRDDKGLVERMRMPSGA
jgi:hypothetical protein